ncbi:MAG: hypothetical protein LBQ43_00130 [Holosporales bacterium]|jgi:hypothetical protein|nr:hypothetical protein [Holosporales bacterium]
MFFSRRVYSLFLVGSIFVTHNDDVYSARHSSRRTKGRHSTNPPSAIRAGADKQLPPVTKEQRSFARDLFGEDITRACDSMNKLFKCNIPIDSALFPIILMIRHFQENGWPIKKDENVNNLAFDYLSMIGARSFYNLGWKDPLPYGALVLFVCTVSRDRHDVKDLRRIVQEYKNIHGNSPISSFLSDRLECLHDPMEWAISMALGTNIEEGLSEGIYGAVESGSYGLHEKLRESLIALYLSNDTTVKKNATFAKFINNARNICCPTPSKSDPAHPSDLALELAKIQQRWESVRSSLDSEELFDLACNLAENEYILCRNTYRNLLIASLRGNLQGEHRERFIQILKSKNEESEKIINFLLDSSSLVHKPSSSDSFSASDTSSTSSSSDSLSESDASSTSGSSGTSSSSCDEFDKFIDMLSGKPVWLKNELSSNPDLLDKFVSALTSSKAAIPHLKHLSDFFKSLATFINTIDAPIEKMRSCVEYVKGVEDELGKIAGIADFFKSAPVLEVEAGFDPVPVIEPASAPAEGGELEAVSEPEPEVVPVSLAREAKPVIGRGVEPVVEPVPAPEIGGERETVPEPEPELAPEVVVPVSLAMEAKPMIGGGVEPIVEPVSAPEVGGELEAVPEPELAPEIVVSVSPVMEAEPVPEVESEPKLAPAVVIPVVVEAKPVIRAEPVPEVGVKLENEPEGTVSKVGAISSVTAISTIPESRQPSEGTRQMPVEVQTRQAIAPQIELQLEQNAGALRSSSRTGRNRRSEELDADTACCGGLFDRFTRYFRGRNNYQERNNSSYDGTLFEGLMDEDQS